MNVQPDPTWVGVPSVGLISTGDDNEQIHNTKGEKWFMRILNGKVLGKNTEDPVLASALWCEPNNVAKLSVKFTNPETCEIRSIIDAGAMSKFRK